MLYLYRGQLTKLTISFLSNAALIHYSNKIVDVCEESKIEKYSRKLIGYIA